MTIGKKIIAGFIGVLLILTALATYSYVQLEKVDGSYSDLIDEKAKILIMVKDIEITAKQVQSGLRGYLIIGDEEALDFFNRTKEDYQKASDQLAQALELPEAQKLLSELDTIAEEYISIGEEAIQLHIVNKMEYAAVLESSVCRQTVVQLSHKAEELSSFQNDVMESGQAKTKEDVDSTKLFVFILSIFAIIVGILVATFTGRLISRPVIKLTAAAKKIAAGDLSIEKIQVNNKYGESGK